jgi:hypothetical protein
MKNNRYECHDEQLVLRFVIVITGPVYQKNVGLLEDACHAVNKGSTETELPSRAQILNSLPG